MGGMLRWRNRSGERGVGGTKMGGWRWVDEDGWVEMGGWRWVDGDGGVKCPGRPQQVPPGPGRSVEVSVPAGSSSPPPGGAVVGPV